MCAIVAISVLFSAWAVYADTVVEGSRPYVVFATKGDATARPSRLPKPEPLDDEGFWSWYDEWGGWVWEYPNHRGMPTWDAKSHKWVTAGGKFCASPGSNKWQPVKKPAANRYVTLPAKGHWATQRICGRYGCRYVRRWVQTAPGGRVLVEDTPIADPQAKSWPSYPSQSESGRRWRFNGGQITAEHLANPHSHHAHEHFDYAWLKTLSRAQLTALGSDAHEGSVREQYVVRIR